MLSEALNNEKANAVVVIALSGLIAAKVTNGPGPVSPGRVVSGVLSNPVRRTSPTTHGFGSSPRRTVA